MINVKEMFKSETRTGTVQVSTVVDYSEITVREEIITKELIAEFKIANLTVYFENTGLKIASFSCIDFFP